MLCFCAFVQSIGPRKEIKVKGKLHLKEFLGITVELIKTLVRKGGREGRREGGKVRRRKLRRGQHIVEVCHIYLPLSVTARV